MNTILLQRCCLVWLWLLAVGLAFGLPTTALGLDDPVETGRKALRSERSFPWYDAEKDEVKRVHVRPPGKTNDEGRGTNWERQLNAASDDPTASAAPVAPPGVTTSWIESSVLFLFYAVIFGLLGLLLFFLIKAFLRNEDRTAKTAVSSEDEDFEGDAARVENLPFQVQRPKADLLSAARSCYEEGDYSRAIIYLYSHELVQLDRHQQIRLARGKTNRQYLHELRDRPDLQSILRETMFAFEDVFFGHHELERERFERCWQQLPEFDRLLSGLAEVAG